MAKQTKETSPVVVSRSDDGSIQITFTIAWEEISAAQEKVVKKLGETITVPGFRAGKAPAETVASHIPQETLIQETVSMVLPSKITDAYKEHSINPIMYPKIELLHAHDGEAWEIRATTAQVPEVKLGEYKEKIKGALGKASIWTPEQGSEKPKEMSAEEKENIALRTILEGIEVTLPAVLIEEEANHRISNLLSRLEKLGLSLENYLASQNKDAQSLRAEYAKSAAESLKIELILGKIAEEQKIVIAEEEIEAFAKATEADPRRAGQPVTNEEKNTIRTLLMKRKAIDHLVS